MEEIRSLLSSKSKTALIIALVSAIAGLVSAVGTAIASIIIALKTKG